jgi:hypothetical protein
MEHGFALTKPPQHCTTVGADFTHAFSRWLQKRCGMHLIPKTERKGMVSDSGATSHFVQGADDLPATGSMCMSVTLPNGESVKAHIQWTYRLSNYLWGQDMRMFCHT